MAEPLDSRQFGVKHNANQRFSGAGVSLMVHHPCPFCAEPDFLVHRVIETRSAWEKGNVCQHCKRGAKAVYLHIGRFEIVQTEGPEQPAWFDPKMRTVEEAERDGPYGQGKPKK